MARNKHTALFEVIKAPPKPEPVSRPSNSWFGKAVMTPPAETAPEGVLAIETVEEPDSIEPPSCDAHISVDPGRKEFVFRLSYTGAAVCSFGVMVGLVGAFVLGQRSQSNVPVLAATTTEELQARPPEPSVLQLSRPAAPVEAAQPAQPREPAPQTTEPAKDNRTWIEPKPPETLIVQDAKRTIGLHYALIQSYPKEEEAMAVAARDALLQQGIDCTVEKGLPGWGPEWFSVIGTTGFDKVRSGQFEQHIRKIMAVNTTLSGTAKFKRFDPMAYKWRGTRAGN